MRRPIFSADENEEEDDDAEETETKRVSVT